ncbi:HupE/UreJ family protein [Sulfitobacter aestuariivivens]|uniref:HupE/UreJ family protein n=1 Tax=Sulfitobacter aestuariivivens TaxID=2766981 RepID=A0A927HEF9_9RHOB|nr:HupE/UreJ family protein [Sulfitobacter aestuariivivens]MBD3663324.1 HupE/UreJ family protein [Sulfitobacter aestuariivivens]
MTNTLSRVLTKLTLLLALSSALLLTIPRAQAHELQPTIADISRDGETLNVVMRLNLEALLAGIDLDGLEDTDDAENVADYDSLRALSAQEIIDRAPALLDQWNALPLVRVDGAPVALKSSNLEIPGDVDIELARISTWTLQGDVAADARALTVTWPDGAGAIVVRQQGVDAPFTGYLDGGDTSPEIAFDGGGAQSGWQAFVEYIPVGFDHILPKGLDHILFVLGLFLLSTQLGPLLWQVSAFTLAHTVTLALGALGWVNVPGSIVEPLIAASIVYVAVENIFLSHLSRWRPFVIFGFGLLHGLGFASVLGDFGLPEGQFIPALIGFNIGVELGQLTVIAMAALLIWLALRAAWYAELDGEDVLVREHSVMFRAISIVGSLIIAIIGTWWVIERVFL